MLHAVGDWLRSQAPRPPLILLSALGDIIPRPEQELYGVSACLVNPSK
jgi:hypothetical protein